MERFALTAQQAFATLRRYSQDQNSRIHDIAAEIIATRHLPATLSTPTRSTPLT